MYFSCMKRFPLFPPYLSISTITRLELSYFNFDPPLLEVDKEWDNNYVFSKLVHSFIYIPIQCFISETIIGDCVDLLIASTIWKRTYILCRSHINLNLSIAHI